MDRKFFLAVALSFTVLLIFQIWFAPKRPPQTVPVTSDTTRVQPGEPELRPVAPTTTPVTGTPAVSDSALAFAHDLPEEVIHVGGENVDLSFTNHGGRLANCTLKDFKAKDGTPVSLVRGDGELGLVLETEQGFIDLSDASFSHREEAGPAGERVIVFEAVAPGGVRVSKRYTVPKDGNVMRLVLEVSGNESITQYRLAWSRSLPMIEDAKLERSASMTMVMAGKDVTKLNPGAFKRAPEREVTGNVRWAGVRNKYFFAGMVPPPETSSRVVAVGDPSLQETGVQIVMPLQGGSGRHEFHVYLGPLDWSRMKVLHLELEHAVDLGYKFVRPLSQVLLISMEWLYKFIPNFGLVIIIISALTKILFYPLTRTSIRSMRALQHLQPKMTELREKYKKDPQRMQKEMMALYKENKVNPMGGCLPILVQMPVFIALYAVLANCIELRQAPFVGWIDDLSLPDVLFRVGSFPIHVLPFIMFLTTIWQQKLTPMTDPRQKMIGYLMPVMMLFLFYSFPAGLNLYWTVNNLLTVAQQWSIHREADGETKVAA